MRYTYEKYKDNDGLFSVIKKEKDLLYCTASVFDSGLSEQEADRIIQELYNQ